MKFELCMFLRVVNLKFCCSVLPVHLCTSVRMAKLNHYLAHFTWLLFSVENNNNGVLNPESRLVPGSGRLFLFKFDFIYNFYFTYCKFGNIIITHCIRQAENPPAFFDASER